jgi:hypothetical protein
VDELIDISKSDWDSREVSWGFKGNSMVRAGQSDLASAFECSRLWFETLREKMLELEEKNNRLFSEMYGFGDKFKLDEKEVTVKKLSKDFAVKY